MNINNKEKTRNPNFKHFNRVHISNRKKFTYSFSIKRLKEEYDFFSIGSDQVWNPFFGLYGNIKFLDGIDYHKKFAYSASFGVSELPKEDIEDYKKGLKTIKYISVREERGKEIIEELTGRKDAEVLIDPTMLLTADEWDKVSRKPKNLKCDKYILNYFLGELSSERKKEIERVAKENNCEIINIMDPKDPFYKSGPSEFLYLEKNAFLICTDSFHSCVFSILYNRPFVVFDREQVGMDNMGSRIDTIINKFNLQNRRFEGKITKENLEHDYSKAYEILEDERKKSDKFLRKALNLDEHFTTP